MKIALFLLTLSLLGCSLPAPTSRVATEELEHHGLTVAVGDNPADCIACHADQAGKGHHPVAISYPPKGKAGFVPVAELKTSGIRFFKNQLACTSCHNLKSPGKSHLVIDNGNSRLCLLCHRL